MGTIHTFHCAVCPFVSSDPTAIHGHTERVGWLGTGERHYSGERGSCADCATAILRMHATGDHSCACASCTACNDPEYARDACPNGCPVHGVARCKPID